MEINPKFSFAYPMMSAYLGSFSTGVRTCWILIERFDRSQLPRGSSVFFVRCGVNVDLNELSRDRVRLRLDSDPTPTSGATLRFIVSIKLDSRSGFSVLYDV